MPYVLPSDLETRTLGLGRNPRIALRGAYIAQRFVLPTNSLSGDYRSQRVVLSGGVVPEIMTRPPFRSLAGWFDESTAGIPNKFLALGGGLLAVMLFTGGRRGR